MEIVNNSNFSGFPKVAVIVMPNGSAKHLKRKKPFFVEMKRLDAFAAKILAIVEERQYNIPSIVL